MKFEVGLVAKIRFLIVLKFYLVAGETKQNAAHRGKVNFENFRSFRYKVPYKHLNALYIILQNFWIQNYVCNIVQV